MTTNATVRGLVATALSLALAATTLAAGPTPAAAASTCSSGVPGDVNGDGYAEVAVSQRRPPSVSVFYGSRSGLQVDGRGSARNDQVFSEATPGIPGSATPRDDFGRATTFGDFNGDGCADLAVANPVDSRDGASVTVLYGSPRGLTTTGLTRLRPVGGVLDDFQGDFGFRLGAGDLTADGLDELVVGVPGAIDSGSDVGDGALVVYTGGRAGLSGATDRRIPLTTSEVGGLSYGDVDDFAIGDFDGNGRAELAVNAPDTAVVSFDGTGGFTVQADIVDGSGADLVAGDTDGDGRDDLAYLNGESSSVVLLFGSASGLGLVGSREWRPRDVGLGNDYGGLTLAMGRLDAGPTEDLVIGGPDTKVGSKPGAGAVTVLFGRTGGPTPDHRLTLSEASTGVPGSAETNDLFGAAVATAFIQGGSQASLLVGAPRDDRGRVRDAGRFYTFPRGSAGPRARGSRALTLETPGVKGSSATSSRFGLVLGAGTPHL